ncbi:hypothetical protein BS47DRAFT_1307411, partial [Hydnum rufescens UP504]
HASQHLLIPLNDEANTRLTAAEIYTGTLRDMYTYCKENGLSQSWAYLWNCWYCPDKWSLWTWSSGLTISVMCTTMIVEGFWNQLKHTTIHGFNWPQLNIVVHLVLTQILPVVCNKLEYRLNCHCIGRPKWLTNWQADFKKAWTEYSKTNELC